MRGYINPGYGVAGNICVVCKKPLTLHHVTKRELEGDKPLREVRKNCKTLVNPIICVNSLIGFFLFYVLSAIPFFILDYLIITLSSTFMFSCMKLKYDNRFVTSS